MTTEELRLKITADTSDVKRKVQDVKKELADIDSSANGAGLAKGAKASTKSIEELKDAIEGLRNFNVFDAIAHNLEAIDKHAKDAGKNFKSFGRHVKEAMGSVALGFNSKHWRELGYDSSITENLKNIKWGFEDAKESWTAGVAHMSAGFKDLGAVVDNIVPPMMRKIALLVGVIVSLVAVIKNALRVSDQGKQMNVLAQQAGMTAQSYQKWAYVLGQTGLAVDDMIGAQQTLLEAQVDVREGNEEMIEAFKQIGLSQSEVLGMNQQQLFERTVAGLQNMGNATERATVAFKLLSEDSKNLAPLLNLTNEQVATLANNYNNLHSSMSDKLIVASNRMSAALGNLRAAWQGLKNTLAEAVLPVLTRIVNWLTKAIVAINLFIRTIFGMEIGGSGSSSVDNATESVGGYTESVDKATEAVQKLKRTTMGFDELNIVNNPNSSGSSGSDTGSGAFSGGFAGGLTNSLFGADSIDTSKIEGFFEKWKNLIQDMTTYGLIGIGLTMAVIGGLTGNLPLLIKGIALASVGIAIGSIDDGSFDRLIKKYGDTIHGVIAPALIGIGATLAVIGGLTANIPLVLAGVSMAGIGISLSAMGNENGFQGYIDRLKGMLPDILNWATVAVGACGAVLAIMTGNIPAAVILAGIAGIGFYNIATGGNFWEDASQGIKKAWDGLKTWWNGGPGKVFTKQWWSEKFGSFKDSMNEKLGETRTNVINGWNNIKSYWSTNIGPKFTLSYWKEKFDTVRAGFQDRLGAVRTQMINSWNSIKDYWNTNIAPKFTAAYWKNKFDTVRAGASEKVNAAKTAIQNAWNNTVSWFNGNVKSKFTVSYWQAKFNTVRDGAKSAFNGVIDIVEKAVNRIINKINTLSWKIPDWVPSVGGQKFGFNFKTISIPRLATGGIATRSTLANIGENGREAILPLDNNTAWMDALATKLAQRMNPATKVVLQVNERELGYATINAINQNTKQTGGLKLQLV